jgi:hypothetical protein
MHVAHKTASIHNTSTILPETAIANSLLHYRLRWYAVSTARLLLRRWQALVLLMGVLASANASVFGNMDTFARPLLLVLAPGHGPIWRSACLALLMAACALWAHMQREQIGGGGFMGFAASLPFSPAERRRVDLAVLALADTPLLLMMMAALATTAAHGGGSGQVLLLAALVPLALAVQLATQERRPAAAAPVALACLLLATGFDTRFGPALSVSVAVLACLALRRAPWPRATASWRPRIAAPAWRGLSLGGVAGRRAPALRVCFAILLRERRDETLAKALGAGALIAAALALCAVFEHDARARAVALLAQGLVALQLSGLFRGLQMAHLAGAAYTAALPLPRRWWRRFDLAALLCIGLPLLAPLSALAWLEGATPGQALASLVSYAGLLSALRAPQLASERHAVVLSTILAGCWMAATIACLY